MERRELKIRLWIQRLLQDYTLEQLLYLSDVDKEDCLYFMYCEYGLKLPNDILDSIESNDQP